MHRKLCKANQNHPKSSPEAPPDYPEMAYKTHRACYGESPTAPDGRFLIFLFSAVLIFWHASAWGGTKTLKQSTFLSLFPV